MQSILTQCPRCETSFKVSDKQLAIAEGMVRCGSCLDVFSATENRITIKQAVSETPPVAPYEDDYEDEEAEDQPQDEGHASRPQTIATITSTATLASKPETFELNYAVTLNYGVGQLVATDITTGGVTAASALSHANEDDALDFVLDDEMDDIPLGDMVLDAADLDELEADEFEADDESEDTIPGDEASIAESIPDVQQQPFDEKDAETAPASALESGADFTDANEANPPEDTEPTIADSADEQDQNIPVNQESLYEAYAANIPAAAPAEEAQEIMAHRHVAWQDGDDSLDAADSFTAANFADTDEFQVPGFSALIAEEADAADEFAAGPTKPHTQHDKEELRQYLAELEDADALETLSPTTMDTIEADPLTFEVGTGLRKVMSTFGWLCLSLILLAVFVFQVVASNLELMQKSPLYSRYLPMFCRVLDCPQPEPATADIESFSSQDLLVRSHPDIPDALEVSFIFRNDAELPQPFPLIELSFRNRFKRLIANRLLKPLEYLPPELAALDLMPARASVQILLELADPGSEATVYEIRFREAPANPASSANVP
jgi:predicted Zn finger-like uncharacterized protein